jgi:Membrane iron-sulfur containing protein FtrD-like
MTTLLQTALAIALIWGMMSYCLQMESGTGRFRRVVLLAVGFAAGAGAMLGLMLFLAGDTPFTVIRTITAALYLGLTGIAVGQLLTGRSGAAAHAPRRSRCAVWAETAGLYLFPALMGALASANLAGTASPSRWLVIAVTLAAALFIANIAYTLLTLVPRKPRVTPLSLFLLNCSLVFCASALSPRLDLFAPLSMKIMKFTHDFLHQFMESMLLPDHLFITGRVWDWIGFLFSREVGFWGGLLLWYAPPVITVLVIIRTPLPAVAHVRIGALRRGMIAVAIRERRRQLVIPLLSAVVLAWTMYRSLYPVVRYWDPVPVVVEASAAGEIEIPVSQGEMDLRDGRLHKFSYARGDRKIRFFVLNRRDALIVALDACAICPPEGYGQGEGTVICYYCKTLIPLETAGLPGGCNPVPVPFASGDSTLRISVMQLVNLWDSTVQTTQKNAGEKR